jgi:carboxyl-terminal processing protease
MKTKLLPPLLLAAAIGFSGATAALSPSEIAATAEQRRATSLIVQLMANYHYRKLPLDDALSVTLLERYVESLDPNRSLFMQSDIDEFYNDQHRMDDFLIHARLEPAFEIFRVFRQRIEERVDFANSLLADPFDFTVDEMYEFDRTAAEWPTNMAELDEIWRKRVKNDFLTLLLSGKTQEEARETLTERYDRLARRANQLDSNDVYQLFINSYTSAVEPHTSYFSPRASEDFQIRMSLSLEGIGAALQTESEYTVVRRIIPGGPAEKSKELHVEDRIIGVGQGTDEEIVDVVSWRLEDVVALIRGPKGSVVRLQVLRKGSGSEEPGEIITLVRNKIQLEDQAAQSSVLDLDGHKIGVIRVPTFYLDLAAVARGETDYRSTTKDVRGLIAELVEEGAEGIVVDLRGNGGGSLAEATELTGLFIESGPVVQVRDSSGRVKINEDPDPSIVYEGPLAVLVDSNSASASEIFAGAIQDYHRGILVGEPTYGKGTVQNVIDLDRFVEPSEGGLGQLKVTIAQFFRITGGSTQHRGVVPDIVFPTALDADTQGERSLDNALPWASIRPVQYDAHDTSDNFITEVRARHLNRIEDDPGFRYLVDEARARREIRNQDSVSLVKTTRRTERDARERAQRDRENAYRAGVGMEPVDQEEKERADMGDLMLNETAHILSDMIDVRGDGADTLQATVPGAPQVAVQ